MKTNTTLYIILSLWLILGGCQKKIDFNADLISSKLVINGIIEPDSIIDILIATSKPIPGVVSDYIWINDATVVLYEDGEKIETLYTYDIPYADNEESNDYQSRYEADKRPEKRYRSKLKTKAGSTYKLEITHPDYEDVSCETSIPKPIQIISYDTITTTSEKYGYEQQNLDVKIKFQDPANEANYYRMIAYIKKGTLGIEYNENNDTVVYISESYSNIDDPIVNPENEDANDLLFDSPWNQYGVFTDELIDGKEYTINISLRTSESNYRNETIEGPGEFYSIKFILQTISREAYLYIKSSDEHRYYDGQLFVEPVQVFSNVKNGIGILGGVSSSSFTIDEGFYPIEGIEYREGSNNYYYYW